MAAGVSGARNMGMARISKAGPFHIGIAYSPHYGHNFGDEVWGVRHGLHDPARARQVYQDFDEYAAHGVTVVSMKIFDDGRTGIDFETDDPGVAVRVHPSALAGLENVLAAASACGVHLHLVMLDHLFAYPSDGGPARGHGAALREPRACNALFERVLLPVLRLVGRRPQVLGIELINEPDLIGEGMHGNTRDHRGRKLSKIPEPALTAVMRRFRDAVDAETDAQFAVGCLGVGKARYWIDSGLLDPSRHFLSIHYFGTRANGDPKYSKLYGPSGIGPLLDLDLPIVWGEHRADGGPASSITEFLEDADRHGVKGCFAWAAYDANGHPGGDHFGAVQLARYQEFARGRQTPLRA